MKYTSYHPGMVRSAARSLPAPKDTEGTRNLLTSGLTAQKGPWSSGGPAPPVKQQRLRQSVVSLRSHSELGAESAQLLDPDAGQVLSPVQPEGGPVRVTAEGSQTLTATRELRERVGNAAFGVSSACSLHGREAL